MNRLVFLLGGVFGALAAYGLVGRRRELRLRLLDVVVGDWSVVRNVHIEGTLKATTPAVISGVRLDVPPDAPGMGIVVRGSEFAVIRNNIVMGTAAREDGGESANGL